jgi:hypothetical protein
MPSRDDDATREERLTEIIEEFRVSRGAQAERLAAAASLAETARGLAEIARKLSDAAIADATHAIRRFPKHK